MKRFLGAAACLAALGLSGCTLHLDAPDGRIIEETAFYKVICQNDMYTTVIYNKNHETVRTEGPASRQPRLSIEDGSLVKFTMQAGTGISTQWGYFYDEECDRFSDIFYSIYDVSSGKFVTRSGETVIVRDIFNEEAYYYEITSFRYPLAKVVEPFIDVTFMENCLNVTYLTGENFERVTEILDLP